MAQALESMRPRTAVSSMRLVAETLAQRPPRERSEMSRLIVSRLSGDAARTFMKATAEVRLASPVQPQAPADPGTEQPPQHENVLHNLDLLPPKQLAEPPATTPGGRDRQRIEALDLATADLVAAEERTDDVRDASTMGYLREASKLINTIGAQGTTYSQERRAELGPQVTGTTQEHIVEQIGFRAAKTQRVDKGGLSTQNDLAATYWRTNFRDTLEKFVGKLRVSGLPGPGDLVVNSPRVLRKLEMMVPPDVVAALKITPLAGKTGVSVLSGTDKFPDIDWNSILQELGATPSAYQMYALMDTGKQPPPDDLKADTRADLVQLITSSPFSRLQEIARGKGEVAPVLAMIEHLVLGLTDDLGPDRYDPLTANALGSLSRLIDIAVAYEHNPTVAMRAADLMMDEIGVVLAAAGNYTRPDYLDAMRAILLERAPSIAKDVGKRVQLDSHLMTSGMDALATALSIALGARYRDQVSRPTEKIDYFETGLLLGKLKKGQTVAPRDDVLVAALNPSTPFNTPDPGRLVADVLKAVQTRKKDDPPFALILDSTIETAGPDGSTQLDTVLGGLKDAVADGRLEIFLCKSFQKYASFGTGKVAAGDLTLLSKPGARPSGSTRAQAMLHESDLDLARHDEAQLVVHMLKHGHRDELALIADAARNARFVDAFCWPIDPSNPAQGSTYVDGIPLLLRSTPTGKVDALFKNLVQIDQRDSFSFLRTSYVGGIPGPWESPSPQDGWYVRINPGHESKESMVECFYAFGHLTTSTPPGAKGPVQAGVDLGNLQLKSVREHLAALNGVADGDDPDLARFRTNVIASYCAFALQNVRPRASALPLLLAFFARPMDGVTIETRRYLAGELLSLAQAKDLDPKTLGEWSNAARAVPMPGAIAADGTAALSALRRAAAVLPAWQLKPLAEKLRLKLDGDTEEATRLRGSGDGVRLLALVGQALRPDAT
ncbi:hypothetical protein BKM31_16810 [[Actinomadura] parvosata subsp. kistnae]|uniref:Uncharacterized protein n=1 Tax=[Actinomadura] parvosata subsp. kistnae TaxID=1909395 RepID=A0A1U9ZY72_9ACTN|nr:hypothetical protein BKM31_16810 [Nonomuraea sp. ATCC 55076]